MVHQHDLSSHRAERERRMVTETVRAGTGASTPALPRSRGGGDLLGSMSLSYMPLCSGASVGITKAAMVHQHDLSSHRMARDRRDLVSSLEPQSDGYIATPLESVRCGTELTT